MRNVILLVICLSLCFLVSYIGRAEEHQLKETLPNVIKEDIKIEAEGGILHYQKESFWEKESFYEILNSKVEFGAKEIDSFKRDVERYGRYILNPRIKFDESKKSTFLFCDVKGAREGHWYDFDWFLRPLGLDFLDSHFERKNMELYWEGKIRGEKTTISIKFPFPISNCHEHVWRR